MRQEFLPIGGFSVLVIVSSSPQTIFAFVLVDFSVAVHLTWAFSG